MSPFFTEKQHPPHSVAHGMQTETHAPSVPSPPETPFSKLKRENAELRQALHTANMRHQYSEWRAKALERALRTSVGPTACEAILAALQED